ncbi:MAG: hypothetical protein K9G76_08030 [Bacteroidales bacterium]|nr:hypothetical protein [Bacteroidales bacterium]MCF8403566.1 hypothetical protein [Bacteroidales bacterium]
MKKSILQLLMVVFILTLPINEFAQIVSPENNFDSAYFKQLNYLEDLADDQR